MLHNDLSLGLLELGRDQGTIEDEEYLIKLTLPGPVFDQEELKNSFGDSGIVLARALLTIPYPKVKGEKSYKIRLDEKDFVLEEGKHYKIVA